MSGQEKRARGRSSGDLSTINEHAAGLDVGSTFHVVAVRGDQDEEPVRTFRSFSGDLHKMADWLTTVGIKTVAMESTGVYWIPVFEILEARGFEVLLVNARNVKNVPGRKTDVNDAQWLQQLHQYGLCLLYTSSSRVPGTRPGRPTPGWVARISTARRIRSATSAAFCSESFAMRLRRATRCRIALGDHTTFIAGLWSHPFCPKTGATSTSSRD